MPRLLVEFPDGNQQFLEIDETGSFFDESKVMWDERTDGELPNNIILGRMKKEGNQLVLLPDFDPEYLELKQAKDAEDLARKNADLWKAADAYIYATINGVALSILTLGVSNAKPKALAVAAWCDAVWTEYYVRKAQITLGAEPNLDFSPLGDKPYTVLELREEVKDLWSTP